MAGAHHTPYAGRWVARLRGRVVAQGGTPDQALRAARGARFKETPEIVFMPFEDPLAFSPLVESVRASLPDDLSVYLVGGAVRDAFLRRVSHDLDFALASDGIKTARRVANALKADFYPLDPERDTGRVIVLSEDGSRTFMDFATFRGPDLAADLGGRDFTVNAIAMDLHTRALHDPLGGALDLKEKRLRACSPSAFDDDPVRILRGVRLAAAHTFQFVPETRRAMKRAVGGLPRISPERLRDEFFRILEGPQPATCLRVLDAIGALEHTLPELTVLKGIEQPAPHVQDVWLHTLAVMQYLESILAALGPEYREETAPDWYTGMLLLRLGRFRRQFAEHFAAALNLNRSLRGLLFLAALYHDVAKPAARSLSEDGKVRFLGHDEQGAALVVERARQLSLSNDEIERLDVIVRNHMRIHYQSNGLVKEKKEPSRRAIYRFFRDTGPAGVDLVLLGLADCRATYEQTLPQDTWTAYLDDCRLLLENLWEKPQETVAPPPLLNGNDLMKTVGMPSGPRVGELLEAVREAQATGKVSTREQALALAHELVQKTPPRRED
jgi:tRNA nucleotidyltransferase/poly(A) polymerase